MAHSRRRQNSCSRWPVAHTTQSPYRIKGHTRLAAHKGANPEKIMEAIWVVRGAFRSGVGKRIVHRLMSMSKVVFDVVVDGPAELLEDRTFGAWT